jgi:ferredoxin
MRVTVDREVCIGSGNCVRLAGDVFDQDEVEGVVVLLIEEPSVEREASVREAAATCPTGAITIIDD